MSSVQAVVAEIRGRKAAVLDRDGIVRIVRNKNYRVGQTITVPGALETAGSSQSVLRRLAAPAAACMLVVGGVGGVAVTHVYPYTTVTLDINPSLGYHLNMLGKVLSVSAFNDDAEEIVSQITGQVEGRTISEAIEITLDQLEEEYITDEETAAVITVSNVLSDTGALEEMISEGIDAWNSARDEAGSSDSVDVRVVKATKEDIDQAYQNHESPGAHYLREMRGEGPDSATAAGEKPGDGEGSQAADSGSAAGDVGSGTAGAEGRGEAEEKAGGASGEAGEAAGGEAGGITSGEAGGTAPGEAGGAASGGAGEAGGTAPDEAGDSAPGEAGGTAPDEAGDSAPGEAGGTAPGEAGDNAPGGAGGSAPGGTGGSAPGGSAQGDNSG